MDVFVARIKADGSQLVWARLLGGASDEWSSGLALNSVGDLFVAGYTRSSDLPTTPLTSFDPDNALGGAQDGFVTKLTGGSGVVQWSSYLGGSADERVVAVAATPDGDAVVVGDTDSADFPTVAAWDNTLGGNNDAFVTRVAGNGSSLVWSTYLGGGDKEHDLVGPPVSWAKGDVALDSAGNVLVAGQTYSSDFPTTSGAYQTVRRGNNDGFITKIAANGSLLLWSSFLGGTGPADPDGREEIAWGIALNPWDEVFVVGWSQSINYPTTPDVLKANQANRRARRGTVTELRFTAGTDKLKAATHDAAYP